MIGANYAAAAQAATAAASITPEPPLEGAPGEFAAMSGLPSAEATPAATATAPMTAAPATPVDYGLPVINFPQRTIKDAAERNVYDDLPSHHLWLRDKVVSSRIANSNTGYYFDNSRLTIPNEALALQAEAQVKETRFQGIVQTMLDEGLQVDLLDPELVKKDVEVLRDLLREIPKPPKPEEMQGPTWQQGVAALIASLVDPAGAATYAAQPFQYQAQRRQERYQQAMIEYEADKQAFQLKYQLEASQAERLANVRMVNNQLTNQARQASIARLYDARMADANAGQQWEILAFQTGVEFKKMDKALVQQIALAHLDVLTSGRPSSVEQRKAAAAAVYAITGIEVATSGELTDQEKIVAEQARQLVNEGQILDATRDARIRTANAQASVAESTAIEAGVQASTAQERAQLQLEQMKLENESRAKANQYLDEQARAQLEATYAATDGQRIQNGQNATPKGLTEEQKRLYIQAAANARGSASEQRIALAERKDSIIEQLKEEGKWLNYGHKEGGLWGVGGTRLSNEEVDRRNQQLLQDRLRQDPVAGEHERAIQEHENNARQFETYLNSAGSNIGKNPVGAGDLGKKYQDQGLKYSMPRRGEAAYTDCSEFTQCVYRDMGIQIPGTAGEQWTKMTAVPKGQESLGDLIFFHDKRATGERRNRPAHHVGVIVGFTEDGTPIMRHASSAANAIVDVPLDKYMRSVGGRMTLLGVKR